MRGTRLLTALVTTAFLSALLVSAPAQASTATIAPQSSAVPGKPGDIITATPSVFYFDPLKATRPNAHIERLVYVSTGFDGKKTRVSATLITPKKKWIGVGKRPLVAYAPGTQGMDERCGPSRLGAAGEEYEGLFMAGLLARGYQIVLTDYEGLGEPGDHPYVNHKVLGKNVLDSVRAARKSPTNATPAKSPVFIVGYSEGGNAAAGALEMWPTYAPELNVKAGYAGAVPADLSRVATGLDGSLYAAFGLYAILMVDRSFPELNVRDLVNEKGLAELDKADKSCLLDALPAFAFKKTSSFTKDGSSLNTHLQRKDIAAALESLRLGKKKVNVPVLVGHSVADDVVPYAQGRDMARNWCAKGSKVRFSTTLAPTHIGGAVGMQPELFAFLEARTKNLPFISNCGWF